MKYLPIAVAIRMGLVFLTGTFFGIAIEQMFKGCP